MEGEKANQVMLESTMQRERPFCGVYPFWYCWNESSMVQQFVEQNEHPLMCDLQKGWTDSEWGHAMLDKELEQTLKYGFFKAGRRQAAMNSWR